MMEEYVCKRCDHSWIPRTQKIPKECPNCKSRFWCKDRKIKSIEEEVRTIRKEVSG
jgi:DNA-directed RNA polymerase subunit RPC12/RpoP